MTSMLDWVPQAVVIANNITLYTGTIFCEQMTECKLQLRGAGNRGEHMGENSFSGGSAA